jgi:hypothetical protein
MGCFIMVKKGLVHIPHELDISAIIESNDMSNYSLTKHALQMIYARIQSAHCVTQLV